MDDRWFGLGDPGRYVANRMKFAISLQNFMLAVLAVGMGLALFVTKSQLTHSMNETAALVEMTGVVDSPDPTKISIRRLSFYSPLSFRFQIANPSSAPIRLHVSETTSKGTADLLSVNIIGTNHKQQTVSFYFRNSSRGWYTGVSGAGLNDQETFIGAGLDWLEGNEALFPPPPPTNGTQYDISEHEIGHKITLEEIHAKDRRFGTVLDDEDTRKILIWLESN